MNALDKLLKICDMEGDKTQVGWRKRRDAMEEWIDEHIITAESEIGVVNPSALDSEAMDIVKERLSQIASEELTTYTEYDIKKNKIKAKLTVLKI